MSDQSSILSLQKNIKNSDSIKQNFINAHVSDSEGSESEMEDKKRPIKTPHTIKNISTIDMLIMEQYIDIQRQYLKSQKTIYKLKNEIDTEDVKTRYLKLDLNNAQVEIADLKIALDKSSKSLSKSMMFNAGFIMFFLVIAISYLINRII
jgi:hypothetical protein